MKIVRSVSLFGLATAGLTGAACAASPTQPNIVVILVDDMGYSDLGCYGGEVETPNLDRLAQEGLRYRQFYNTARSCPSRASLMTGLYPHQAGMGWMAAADLGTPPYQGYLNDNCVTLGEVMRMSGYGTYMSGKWHLCSDRQVNGKVIDNWPNQRGFDQYYGTVAGAANYFKTVVNENNDRVPSPDDGSFYFTHAISDRATGFISEHDYRKNPLFLYVAYTAPHWPLHAIEKEIDKYKERYMKGWDVLRTERFERQKKMGLFPADAVLSPRDAQVPAWNSLTKEEQQEFAMRMAIYAAQVDAMDQGVGRIVAELKKTGQLDNTAIMFMSDNGACAEFISSGDSKAVNGKVDTYESYRINWANLSSTPYREYKHFTNEGGIASPMIVHYPNGIAKNLRGGYVDEYGHFADIMATCVDLSGGKYPGSFRGHDIVPMQGVSLVPNFSGKITDRTVTYWEHEANIAVRDGKWKLVAKTPEDHRFDKNTLELYDMEKDPTEMHNLASAEPERVARMYADWERWAESIGAFPLDTREYGIRKQAYMRERINGGFEDNYGDWKVLSPKENGVTFTIDTTDVIAGRKTARIVSEGTGEKGKTAQLRWIFPTDRGATTGGTFLASGTPGMTMEVCVEKADEKQVLSHKKYTLAPGVNKYSFEGVTLPGKGRYQLSFVFPADKKGTCRLDSVELKVDQDQEK